MQKFNTNTIESKFIKSILANTYVPLVQVWKPNKPVIKDYIYITRNNIVKAKKSALENIVKSDTSVEYFDILEPYVTGAFYKNLTANYISNTSIYDSITHKHLGDYLRMIRDLMDIDLMSYYNCWDGSMSDNIRLVNFAQATNVESTTYSGSFITNNTASDGLNVILVPIKFNQSYNIYINSSYPIQMLSMFYNGKRVINNTKLAIKQVTRSDYNHPIEYRVDLSLAEDSWLLHYRDYLTLAIQLPKAYSKNIVVIEGDCPNLIIKNGINELPQVYFGDSINNLSEKDFETYFKTYPSLLRTMSTETAAFSDRLIEYLLLNVITKEDQITEDIARVQEYASSSICERLNGKALGTYTRGIWSRKLKQFLYDITTKNKSTPKTIDISGNIDKDVETIITRGFDV